MPPYLLLYTNESMIYDISGYVGDVWKIIEHQLNIRYRLIIYIFLILCNDQHFVIKRKSCTLYIECTENIINLLKLTL